MTFTPINLSQFVSVKLDNTNYLSWISQIVPVFKSHDLMAIAHGSLACPVATLPPKDEGLPTENPEFCEWNRKDQFVLALINGSLSAEILPKTFGLTSTAVVWDKLSRRFSSKNASRVLNLKRRLQNLKQGNQTCTAFLQSAKLLRAELSAARHMVTDDDLINYIIGGLSPVFQMFVSHISFARQLSALSMDDFESELLTYESLINILTVPEPDAVVLWSTKDTLEYGDPRSLLTRGSFRSGHSRFTSGGWYGRNHIRDRFNTGSGGRFSPQGYLGQGLKIFHQAQITRVIMEHWTKTPN